MQAQLEARPLDPYAAFLEEQEEQEYAKRYLEDYEQYQAQQKILREGQQEDSAGLFDLDESSSALVNTSLGDNNSSTGPIIITMTGGVTVKDAQEQAGPNGAEGDCVEQEEEQQEPEGHSITEEQEAHQAIEPAATEQEQEEQEQEQEHQQNDAPQGSSLA